MTRPELLTQSGEKGIDILVTGIQPGRLLRKVRDALGKLSTSSTKPSVPMGA